MPALVERPSTVTAPLAVVLRDRVSVVHLAVLLSLCALSLFAALGSTPLWEPDEPRFAAATRGMLRSGDYFDPVFNAHPRWEKPVLLYWLQAAPLRLGVDDELAMRLPSAALGALAVVGVYALGVFWWSRNAGLVAAALLATTFRFVTYGRQGLTDIPALAGIVATFLAFEIGSAPERSRRQRLAWWAGWIVVGLTALTKGPLAVIAPAIWIVATWIRRRDAIRWRAIAAGAALAVVVGGSWFVYMAASRGSAFVGVNNYEFLQRYFDRSFPGPSRGPFFYLTILPGEIAPWPLVVAAAVVFLLRNWKALDRRSQDGVVVAAAWAVGVLLICSLSHYKLPHYALPLYPPLMLLAGAAIDRASRVGSWRRVAIVGMVVTASVFIAVGGAVPAGGLPGPGYTALRRGGDRHGVPDRRRGRDRAPGSARRLCRCDARHGHRRCVWRGSRARYCRDSPPTCIRTRRSDGSSRKGSRRQWRSAPSARTPRSSITPIAR